MANPVRINVDGAYVNGLVPIAAASPGLGGAGWFAAVDAAQYASINGDVGTTHAPAALITIQGAGVIIQGATFSTAGLLLNTLGSGSRITHGDDDYVNMGTVGEYGTQYLITNLSDGYDASFLVANSVGRFYYDPLTGSFLNYASNTTYAGGGRIVCPLEVRDQATFVSVTFYFEPASGHAGVPVSLPTFRVIQVDAFGNVTPLCSNTLVAGWVGDGFVQFNPTPGSVGAWTAPQSFVYTIDGGITIDLTQFTYFVEINDESGADTVSGNYYHSARSEFQFFDVRPG
jgi:hypothetical protein